MVCTTRPSSRLVYLSINVRGAEVPCHHILLQRRPSDEAPEMCNYRNEFIYLVALGASLLRIYPFLRRGGISSLTVSPGVGAPHHNNIRIAIISCNRVHKCLYSRFY
jgi:hypothetical protein